jgi:lysyl-tRNA synthetase class I
VAHDGGLPSGKGFAAVYVAFLGRPNGPRAGWLLVAQPFDSVVARLREAAGWRPVDDAAAGAPA